MTGPPTALRSLHTAPWNDVAWTSTSSPLSPGTGSSWHSAQLTALNSGPSPVSGVNTVANTALPRSNNCRSPVLSPGNDRPRLLPPALARSPPVGSCRSQAASPRVITAMGIKISPDISASYEEFQGAKHDAGRYGRIAPRTSGRP